MQPNVLKNILCSLDSDSFSKFIFELWKLKDFKDDFEYTRTSQLPNVGTYVLEQNFRRFEYSGYHFIIPFYQPLELFLSHQAVKFWDNQITETLRTCSHIIEQRFNNWKFYVDGDYSKPYCNLVTNFSGLQQSVYHDIILPEFEKKLDDLEINALAAVGTCDSFVHNNFADTVKAFGRFWENVDNEISISFQDGKFKVEELITSKYLTSGVLQNSKNSCEIIFTRPSSDELIHEFESLLNYQTSEQDLERFLSKHYKVIFGEKYDRVETQISLRFPELDIGHKERRMDIFLRNSIEQDWGIFEIKRCKTKIAKTVRGIPSFVSEVNDAIQQLRNYKRLLEQNKVREHLLGEGIEYYVPEMHLVIGKKPNISKQQWRLLKSDYEKDLKILTYDSLLEEMQFRLHSFNDYLKI